MNTTTAMRAGLVRCHDCELLCRSKHVAGCAQARCPRCHCVVHARRPDAMARAWALTFAGYILYIPANLLPVMSVVRLGRGEPHTILGGVRELIAGEQWAIAALVFIASIVVPVLKLVGLTFLLHSVQSQSMWRPRERTAIYRIIEGVGRWSMVDIFMISILVALVKLGSVATIEPGLGATCFAAVVVITMFAADAFDPRLIWDKADRPTKENQP